MESTKGKIYGIICSILLYIALFFALYHTFLRTETKAEEEGVPVHFGTVDLAAGTFVPKGETDETDEAAPREALPDPSVRDIPESLQTQQTPPVTQNTEQTVAVEAAKSEQARREQEQRKRDAIDRQVTGAFAGMGRQGAGQTGAGKRDNPQSVPAGANGSAYNEFNLGGRTLAGAEGLPKPAYSDQEEGNIVVNITVDPRGNVISAEIGKGTTIGSMAMRKSALDAARKAKFSSIDRNNNQVGTITYKYYLK
ncbi:MAG: TonB family protein [Dysgonamonadaceae bacterium]|jgi:TonB family protein|nr:TonB family protein [Dysgonamonadaceae bacterium]